MMPSVDKMFQQFIEWFISLAFVSQGDLDAALEEFGGVSGVIENEFYVSAYEELGRTLANKVDLVTLIDLMQAHNIYLSKNPDHAYYFVEAIIDEVSAKGYNVNALVDVVPEEYQKFLEKRFS
ncbi:hypothetical protein [Zooshikella sp. RANM57]|uniref:hypothetical protein n=1 Tax=Zooshikella sp. RANM57 TaxID=3425863 RepID=UPI003D6E9EFC